MKIDINKKLNTKKEMLKKINELETSFPSLSISSEHMGNSFSKRIERLFYYGLPYLKRVWEKSGSIIHRDIMSKTFWGREILLPNHDYNSKKIISKGFLSGDEIYLTKFFIKNIKKDDIFYDIGSNYGFYTALAQELIHKGEIHSFEPSLKVFKYLRQLGKSDLTFLNNIALYDEIGKKTFFDSYRDNKSGKSTLIKEVARLNYLDNDRVVVNTTTMDNYCIKHKPPTLIKLDVEGSEFRVLSGARSVLEKYSPIIVTELWSGNRFKFSNKVINVLKNLKYSPSIINYEGGIDSLSYSDLVKILKKGTKNTNFVFKK